MRDSRPPKPIRQEYQERGVAGFYRERGNEYRNPHEPRIGESLQIAVRDWKLDLTSVLDLAAGSGEVTLALRALGAKQITGIDPYTFDAYRRRTGQNAGRETFEQIATGALVGRRYSLIVCSFAMHLLEPSRLPKFAYALSGIADSLLILTPHKRPEIRADWGWKLTEEMVLQRVRSRLYRALHSHQ